MESCVAISARLKPSRSERGEEVLHQYYADSEQSLWEGDPSGSCLQAVQGTGGGGVCCFDELPPTQGEFISDEVELGCF